MTVKKLTTKQKQAVVLIYDSKTRSIKQIADFLGVSTRTIGRVLTEVGVAKPVERMQAEAKEVLALLYKFKISVRQLEFMLETVDAEVLKQTMARIDVQLQTRHTKKSPTSHNGKQTLLPLNLPSLTFLDQK